MIKITDDIKPQWLNVIRRLQSMSYQQLGCAIITVKIVVNEEGIPIFWLEPEMKKLEPARKTSDLFESLLDGFDV